MSIQDLKTAVGNLVKTYPSDLDSNMKNKVTQLKFLRTLYSKKNEDALTAMHLHRIIKENELQGTFPNAEIAPHIRIFQLRIRITRVKNHSRK